jgi:hypothetical protein
MTAATWVLAIATVALAGGAIVTAVFAIRAFGKQSAELTILNSQANDQREPIRNWPPRRNSSPGNYVSRWLIVQANGSGSIARQSAARGGETEVTATDLADKATKLAWPLLWSHARAIQTASAQVACASCCVHPSCGVGLITTAQEA